MFLSRETGDADMTKTIDNLLVKLDFDRNELESDRTRSFLYLAVGFSLMSTLIFVPLALIEILG
jgi:hypothetical protein